MLGLSSRLLALSLALCQLGLGLRAEPLLGEAADAADDLVAALNGLAPGVDGEAALLALAREDVACVDGGVGGDGRFGVLRWRSCVRSGESLERVEGEGWKERHES